MSCLSLRAKLILTFLTVILLSIFLYAIIDITVIGNIIIKQAQDKVRLDLNTAREVYKETSNCIKCNVNQASARFFLKDAMMNNEIEKLQGSLKKIKEEAFLDILTLTNDKKKVLIRAHNPAIKNDSISDPIIDYVISKKQSVVSTQIIPLEVLKQDGEKLIKLTRIKLIPTPKARKRLETEEKAAMMIKAASPIFDYDDNLIGVLYGGQLLNQNYEIVDKVKNIVYKGEVYKGKDIGTATIFQGDLRISTNVLKANGERAIGTQVSQEVYDQVIMEGKQWIGRAFVVNAWYRTAYEPISDIEGKIIGMLYVGMLESPYVDLKRRVVFVLLGITFFTGALLLLIAYFTLSKITKPIKDLVFATQKVAEGDLSFSVETKSCDEIGVLAESFNKMTLSLSLYEKKLKNFAKTLEEKVEERTRELKIAQKQLTQSEKLASLGKMAAGVAHEINNPLTAVLTFSKLLLEDLKEDDPQYEDIQTIVSETLRCRDIVRGLLDFSRETKAQKQLMDINDTIKETLFLLEHQASFQDIEIVKNLADNLPKIRFDKSQIKQVFMNMFLNSAEAMSGKGTLTLTTFCKNEEFIVVKIEDTGCGISEQNLSKLFDPFFTTKKVGQGTGLGLAVTYGIIKNHQGTINVKSEVGKGTEFIIQLPRR